MSIPIQVPPVGESVVEATIGTILKPSGTLVKADEEILELETDKVNQVIYAPAAGLLQLTVKTGDTVKVGQTIGTIVPAKDAPSPSSSKPASSLPPSKPASSPPPPNPASSPPPPNPASSPPPSNPTFSPFKPPAPKSTPTSPAPKSIPPTSSPRSSPGRETRKKMTKLRRVIAEKLVEVKNQTAMLTTFNELDMSAIIAVREKEQENFQKKHGIKLGFMSFFVKAAVAALEAFPELNARIEGDEIVYHHYCDIGVAVSTKKGLLVPVLRNAETLTYAEIEKKLKEFADQARTGSLSLDALQGGTFTITNGGVFGSLLSTPILNPPQSGILGMHNIVKRPVAHSDQIAIRPMMYLALSYDHRIVDGKEAISFLVHIKRNLEGPVRLLLDL